MQNRRTLPLQNDHHWLEGFFEFRPWGRAIILGSLAMGISLFLDEMCHFMGLAWHWERVVEDGLQGLGVGLIVWCLARLHDKRVARRMKEIGFLNHHIRNSLQAIELAAVRVNDPECLAVVKASVERAVVSLSKINRGDEDLPLVNPIPEVPVSSVE